MRIFALHDCDNELKKRGAFEITADEVEKYNQQAYGIFWLLNDFNGRRKQENVTKINFWFCDIDEGSKDEQIQRIKKLTLQPTFIIETHKGYHCYWEVSGTATIENYKEILKGIILKLNADRACKDCSRLLRYPYTYHMKDPKNPFFIQVVDENNNKYTEAEMLYYFALPKEKKEIKQYTNDESIEGMKIYARNITKGGRNNYLYWVKCRLIEKNMDIEDNLKSVNQEMPQPLEESELQNLIRGRR